MLYFISFTKLSSICIGVRQTHVIIVLAPHAKHTVDASRLIKPQNLDSGNQREK